MSAFSNIKLSDLGVEFLDIPNLATENNEDFSPLLFGPTKKQTKSYSQWNGCDGKVFFPYNQKEKLGKISDFVTAANQAAKDKDRDLNRRAD